MKNGKAFAIVCALMWGIVLTATGCATTAREYRTDYGTVYSTRTRIGVDDPVVPVVESPVVATVPPARPAPGGPPQSFAWLHTPPMGCEEGVFSLEIRNSSDSFLAVLIDGEELEVRGARGMLPHLPPDSSAYICLESLGEHTLAAVSYVPRFGELQEVRRYSRTVRFGSTLFAAYPRRICTFERGLQLNCV